LVLLRSAKKSNNVVGIDLGIKELVIFSNEITNIKKEEGHGKELLEITLSRYGNTAIYYDILNDEYLVGNEKFEMFISRKEARLLGKIAATVNPDTQYIKGTGDFRIKGY
jgi:hypothetical protein